ncbi:MAG: cell division protein FtsQ/DivIB, partial [Acidimicrobiia bacterium]
TPPPRAVRVAGAPVDPRVRARWVAARRAEGRRRLRVLLVLVSVTVVVVLAWGVTLSPLLDVDHIVVKGTSHTTAGQVESAGGIHPGDPLAWLDTSGAVARIEALPYVRTARVQREWPDAVKISVTERVPVAWVEGGKRRALVDGSGRVLESVADPPVGMPQLAGMATVPDAGRSVAPVVGARVAAALGSLAAGVRSITVTDAGVSLLLTSGPEVRLGDPTRVGVKVRAAAAVIAALKGTELHYVDVSVPTNPVAG